VKNECLRSTTAREITESENLMDLKNLCPIHATNFMMNSMKKNAAGKRLHNY